ncbi:MAG TPA: hypothetical protein VGF69_15420 [Thermoanaerobaculia bacterium]|jgi:hypothetical protein
MTTVHLLGIALLALAGGATWLERRTTSVRASFIVWIAYVVSLCGGTALLVP